MELFDRIYGGICCSLLGISLIDLGVKAKAYSKDPQAFAPGKNRLILDSLSCAGIGAITVEWAHSVKWIHLGKALSAVRIFGIAAYMSYAGLEAWNFLKMDPLSMSPPKKIYTSLALIGDGSTLVWGATKIAALFAKGVFLFPLVGEIALGMSVVFTAASIFYKLCVLEKDQKACTTGFAYVNG